MVAISRSVGGVWKRKKFSALAASGSLIIDTVPLIGFRSIDYIITFWNVAQDDTKSLHFKVIKENGSLKSIVRDKLGTLSVSIAEAVNSGSMELTITNNEIFAIDIEFVKVSLGV